MFKVLIWPSIVGFCCTLNVYACIGSYIVGFCYLLAYENFSCFCKVILPSISCDHCFNWLTYSCNFENVYILCIFFIKLYAFNLDTCVNYQWLLITVNLNIPAHYYWFAQCFFSAHTTLLDFVKWYMHVIWAYLPITFKPIVLILNISKACLFL